MLAHQNLRSKTGPRTTVAVEERRISIRRKRKLQRFCRNDESRDNGRRQEMGQEGGGHGGRVYK